MTIERGLRAKIRYRWDEFLSGGAGRQLAFLFGLTLFLVLIFTIVSLPFSGLGPEDAADHASTVLDKAWFYFTRMLDAGTMGDDAGEVNRLVSTAATILGVVVAGLLISSLAGNFQERLDAIKRGGSPVMEDGHFLILGWSEKIYSVIDQISEAYASKKIVVVVMAEDDKIEMEGKLRDKVVHQDRMKIVVRSGSSLDLNDLSRVSFDAAQAIVVLVNDADADDPNKADGRIIKTLLAIFNHRDGGREAGPPARHGRGHAGAEPGDRRDRQQRPRARGQDQRDHLQDHPADRAHQRAVDRLRRAPALRGQRVPHQAAPGRGPALRRPPARLPERPRGRRREDRRLRTRLESAAGARDRARRGAADPGRGLEHPVSSPSRASCRQSPAPSARPQRSRSSTC